MEYRMYGLVPYNLSPIQQGIQYGHAVVEYMVAYRDFPNLTKWAEKDKTFIILNGGTTNKNKLETSVLRENDASDFYKGTLNNHLEKLRYMGVKTAEFYEPDLGDQLTAVVFLLDERVWNEEKYPSPIHDFKWDYIDQIKSFEQRVGLIDERNFVNRVEKMGGRKNWELRKFIKQFRLA